MSFAHPFYDRRVSRDRRGGPHPLGGALADAMRNRAVELHYQPQYSAKDGALVGAEALVRWHHPQVGVIAGDELFRIAAGAGITRDLSDHILQRALSAATEWPDHIGLSLNVTAADLAATGFVDRVASALGYCGLSPERLTLEITEQALVNEVDKSAKRLERLVALGISVDLDDFGAGFCNFRYLKLLPLHGLKLDRSMIEGITEDRRDLEVMRAIIAVARALDLTVTAEGIETAEQLEAITREGCEKWQGFLGARAMKREDFTALAIAA